MFAFTYEGVQYTWIVLPQGFADNPTLLSRALHKDLNDVVLTEGATLVQYVDDLLICSTSEDNCKKDTLTLLRELAGKGHKVPKAKLQLCETQVTYRGHVLSGTSRRLSNDRV